MRVEVNADVCVGAGQCVLAAPDVFTQDDDGIVVLLDGEPTSAAELGVREAATLCPARALRVLTQ